MFLDLVHFVVCVILALIYFGVNVGGIYTHFGSGMSTAAWRSNGFALLLSLPFMPFIAGFSPLAMALFALSYLIWQIIYISSQHNVSAYNIVVPLAIINSIAWLVTALVNHIGYMALAYYVAKYCMY